MQSDVGRGDKERRWGRAMVRGSDKHRRGGGGDVRERQGGRDGMQRGGRVPKVVPKKQGGRREN